jgi:hypothetical protein
MKAISAAGDPYFSALAPKKAAPRADDAATRIYRTGLLGCCAASLAVAASAADLMVYSQPTADVLFGCSLLVSAALAGTLALGDRAGRASR